MRCAEERFDVLGKGVEVEKGWGRFAFCPGKATWYEEIITLYDDCRVALETGILPKGGALEDQDPLFLEAFPAFVQAWRERSYDRVWNDVRTFTKSVLEAVFGKKGK